MTRADMAAATLRKAIALGRGQRHGVHLLQYIALLCFAYWHPCIENVIKRNFYVVVSYSD